MKNNYKDTCIIIPCFNEEENIRGLIDRVTEQLPECKVVVIDDASTDNSIKAILDSKKAELVALPVNLGIGGAVQTGLKYARNHGYKYVVRLDGDGQHPVEFAKDLLKPLVGGKADVTIGSRFLINEGGFQSTSVRRIGIRLFAFLNKIIIKKNITDSTSGFRAYNRRLIGFLAENYPAFDYPEPEEIILLGRNNFRIMEVAVQMQDRVAGKSSINTIRSIYYMIKVVFAILMVSIRPKLKRD